MSLRTLLQRKVGEYALVDTIIQMKTELEFIEHKKSFKSTLDLIKNMNDTAYFFIAETYWCDMELAFICIDNKQFCLVVENDQGFISRVFIRKSALIRKSNANRSRAGCIGSR